MTHIVTAGREDLKRIGIDLPPEPGHGLILPKETGLIVPALEIPGGAGKLLQIAGSGKLVTEVDRPLSELIANLTADDVVAREMVAAIEKGIHDRS